MIQKKHACLLFFTLLVFSACEKVIDIDLEDAEPVLVIEGNISSISSRHYVQVQYSVPFSSAVSGTPVSGARVTVREELVDANDRGNSSHSYLGWNREGVDFPYEEVRPGLYEIRNFHALPGRKYTLNVAHDAENYTASSIMPEPLPIDSVGTVLNTFFGEERKSAAILFQDPPNEPNYYRYLMTINGEPSNMIRVFNDRFNDGRMVQRNLMDFDVEFVTGDSVWIEKQCIDEHVYRYLSDIRSNNPGTAAPANPTSNFNNGALGYFSAYGATRVALIID